MMGRNCLPVALRWPARPAAKARQAKPVPVMLPEPGGLPGSPGQAASKQCRVKSNGMTEQAADNEAHQHERRRRANREGARTC